MNGPDVGLETLLELDGSVLEQKGGFWIKIDARQVPASEHALHGIRYSLTSRPVQAHTWIGKYWWPAVGAPLERGVRRQRGWHAVCER